MKNAFFRLSVVLIVLIGLALPVFAGGEAESGAPSGGKEKVELTIWTFVELHQKYYEMMAQKFNEENPDVELVLNTSTIPMNQMHDQLLLSLVSGTGAPDMVDVMIKWAGLFFKSNPEYFVQLNDIVEPYKDVLDPGILQQFSDPELNTLGIPFHYGAGVMFYNKPAFDAAGIDIDKIVYWSDWVEAGKQLHDPENGVWFTAMQYAFAREYLLFTMQKGGYMIDPSGNITVDGAASIEALEFINDCVNTFNIAEIAPNGSVYDQAFFEKMNKGEVLSIPHAYWYTSRFRAYMPDLAGDIAVRPLPIWKDGGIESASMGGTGTAITAQSKNADVAKRFLEYCKLSYEGNVQIATFLGFDPLRSDVYDDPRLAVPDPYFNNEVILSVVAESLDRFVAKPVWPLSTDIQTELSNTVLPNVLTGKEEPAAALRSLAAKYRAMQ